MHPTLIHAWKTQPVQGAEEVFGSLAQPASAEAEARQAELGAPQGPRDREREWGKNTG
ncbi:MAG: hypothetical protein IRY99_09895, partial [Isosphaeraceae bacterium]|nr:hypothetical protein [Isosphaeraceae bacterium]